MNTYLKKFQMMMKTSEVFNNCKDIFDKVFDDGEDIFEKVFDDGEDIFESVFDDIWWYKPKKLE